MSNELDSIRANNSLEFDHFIEIKRALIFQKECISLKTLITSEIAANKPSIQPSAFDLVKASSNSALTLKEASNSIHSIRDINPNQADLYQKHPLQEIHIGVNPRVLLHETSRCVGVNPQASAYEKLHHVATNPRTALHEELCHVAANPQASAYEKLRHADANPRTVLHEELRHVAANPQISAYKERYHAAANSRVSVNHSINRVPPRDWSHIEQKIGSVNDCTVQIQSLLEVPEVIELPQYLIDPYFGRDAPPNIAEIIEKLYEKLDDIRQAISRLTINPDSSTQTQNQTTFTTIDIPSVKDEQPHAIASKFLHEISKGELEVFLEDISSEQMLKLIQNPDNLVTRLTEIQTKIKKECRGSIQRLRSLQTKILIKIDEEVALANHQPIRWSPSMWFGDETISKIDRVNWSKAIRKLKDRGLVEEKFKDMPSLLKPSKGNSISYVSMTSVGIKAAKWLRSATFAKRTG